MGAALGTTTLGLPIDGDGTRDAGEPVLAVGSPLGLAGTVTAKAGQNWDKLESIFEQRTAKALNKLGVPSAKDIDALMPWAYSPGAKPEIASIPQK